MQNNLNENKRKSHLEIGELFFWTATINHWQCLLDTDEYKDVIINSLNYLSEKNKIEVFGFVIMPNHIHLMWRINKHTEKEAAHISFLKYTAHAFKHKLTKETKLNYRRIKLMPLIRNMSFGKGIF
ncbi:MAG: hypothetical protein ACR2KX_11705 [Chitinophagaceae bacterium]